MSTAETPHSSPEPRAEKKRFGRFELLELLGRSELTMAWRAYDPRLKREFALVMPRSRAAHSQQLEHWESVQGKLGRLRHASLVPLVEAGHHEGWPYAVYDDSDGTPMSRLLLARPMLARDAVKAVAGLGEALAAIHQAGMVHGDPQAHLVLKSGVGPMRWIGVGVAFDHDPNLHNPSASQAAVMLAESDRLRVLRELAQRDVLALALLLYTALNGQAPLDEPDTAKAMLRMTPVGRELVRMPWSTPQPIPEALRAIVNRATDRQPRQRYRSIRSLLHALDGWLRAEESDSGSVVELLRERLTKLGLLPASPGISERVARMTRMERKRTDELAEVVMMDVGLTLETLKTVNLAKARAGELGESGPVLTIRSAIALLGLDQIRRLAFALKPWPGVLDEKGAQDLKALLRSTHDAVRLAKALRPPSWEAEVVAVVTLLQQLGRLVIQYHFPDDMAQIRKLMMAAPSQDPGGREDQGMSEQSACFAVLGVDMESMAAAVVRSWGLGDEVQLLMRRLPEEGNVHTPSSDEDYLRTLASCAHEITAARQLSSPQRVQSALAHVIKRYGRALELTHKRMQEALAEANSAEQPDRQSPSRSSTSQETIQ